MNSSIADHIGSILIESCKIPLPNTVCKPCIKNSENDGDLKAVKFEIDNSDASWFVFSLDLRKIKSKEYTELINCDWIMKKTEGIIYKFENGIHKFIIVEIKSRKPGGCGDQFKSMHAFLTYLLKVLELQYGVSILDKVDLAKVLISERVEKSKTGTVYFNEKINANELHYDSRSRPIVSPQLLNCKFVRLIDGIS
jgi:hypothetical protein